MVQLIHEQFLHRLGTFAFRDVAADLGGADNFARLVSERRHCQGDIHQPAILCDSHRIEMLDALPIAQSGEDFPFLLMKLWRDQSEDGLTDDFFGGIAEDARGACIPGPDNAVQGFADNGIFGGGHDGSEPFKLDIMIS